MNPKVHTRALELLKSDGNITVNMDGLWVHRGLWAHLWEVEFQRRPANAYMNVAFGPIGQTFRWHVVIHRADQPKHQERALFFDDTQVGWAELLRRVAFAMTMPSGRSTAADWYGVALNMPEEHRDALLQMLVEWLQMDEEVEYEPRS